MYLQHSGQADAGLEPPPPAAPQARLAALPPPAAQGGGGLRLCCATARLGSTPRQQPQRHGRGSGRRRPGEPAGIGTGAAAWHGQQPP